MKDSFVDRAIRKVMGRQVHRQSEACPAEDLIAAYLEGRLSLIERAPLEAHASSCGRCQEVLALCLRFSEPGSHPGVPERARGEKARFRRALALSLLTSAVVLVFLALVVWRDAPQTGNGRLEIAENRASQSQIPGLPDAPSRQSPEAPPVGKPGETQPTQEQSPTPYSKRAPAESSEEKAETAATFRAHPVAKSQPSPPVASVSPAIRPPAEDAAGRQAAAPMIAQNARQKLRLEDRESLRAPDSVQIEGKAFVKKEGRWVDADYPADAVPVHVTRSSAEFQALLRLFPGLERLAAEGLPVLIRLEGKNYQID